MSVDHWLTFVLASAIMLAIPGPTIVLVISYAISHGRRYSRACVAGVALGDFTAMTASMLGLGALLAASATVFTILKWFGAAYLIYLGIKMWRAPVANADAAPAASAGRASTVFWHAWIVTALNPKSIVFFVAFLPQFLNLSAPIAPQMVIFEATFLVLATANAAAYALAASAARGAIRRPAVQRAVNRTGGTLLVGAGLLTLAWRRQSA